MNYSEQFTKEELKKIGIRMQAVRVLTGMKREEFARTQNLSITTIKNWEMGGSLPRHEGIVAAIHAFKDCGIFASPEWLLYGQGAGPNYYDANTPRENKQDELIDEQIALFKRAQRIKNLRPVVCTIKDDQMAPHYQISDVVGASLISLDFVKEDLEKNPVPKRVWLLKNEEGFFAPAFLYANGDRWFTNTIKNSKIKEIPTPIVAIIKWHYSLGEQVK